MKRMTRYILEVPKKRMSYATDMLRFDSAFQIEDKGDNYRIYCINYTLERWKSFGVIPTVISSLSMTASEESIFYYKASGFIAGIRFAQNILSECPGQPLVEGSI